jgi:hypothetical protein
LSEIVKVPFHGDDVLTVEVGGKVHVILKPAVEAVGLDYDSQRQKLAGKSWATTVLVTAVAEDGRARQMLAADLRTFLMLLATIDERRVGEAARPTLVAYQLEVADAIEAYWTHGRAINPRLGPDAFDPDTWSWDEVAGVLAQRYGIVKTVNDLTRLLRSGGVLKQNGAPAKQYRPWFWFTGNAWQVHPHVVPQLARKVSATEMDLRSVQLQLAGGVEAAEELPGLPASQP